MILKRTKVPVWTALPMLLGGCLLVLTYATMDLWYSVVIETISVVGWAVIYRRSVRP